MKWERLFGLRRIIGEQIARDSGAKHRRRKRAAAGGGSNPQPHVGITPNYETKLDTRMQQ
jgi:hypothetical protein